MMGLSSTPQRIHLASIGNSSRLPELIAITIILLLVAPTGSAQTLKAEEAYNERFCSGWSIFRDCRTVTTRRITRNFTRQYMNSEVAGGLWGGAAHCLTVNYPSQRCAESVAIFSDPSWNRIVWGQPNRFLRAYGLPGDSIGQFQQPAGVAITRHDGEWHVAFVADPVSKRVVALALGYTCRCVKWLGTIDASITGTPLSGPFDVAWDHATTWTMNDDRIFILDTGNDRVVVYRVGPNPAAGTMGQSYVGSFGTSGNGLAQLRRPQGITVRSYRCGTQLCADVYIADTGNRRVVHWYYDTPDPSTPSPNPVARAQSSAEPGADFVGIALDHYGDVFVSDRTQNRIVKLLGHPNSVDLQELKRYGSGSSSWQNGNFRWPTSLKVTRAFSPYGASDIVDEGLPFVNTVELWADTTGIQTHRLGVDVENLSAEVPSGTTDIFGRFLFTATGRYIWTFRSPSGVPIASSNGPTTSRSGWQYPYANASGYGSGTYTLTVDYQSGYMYDDGQWKTKTAYVTISDPNGDPCAANPWAPECNPCPPPQIQCNLIAAAPKSYELAQDLTAAGLSGYDTRPSGLRRVDPNRMPSLQGTALPSATRSAQGVRINGVTGVLFGVPRPNGAPTTATVGLSGAMNGRARIQIRIYDTGGRLVRSAVNEDLSPGYYEYRWDALDERGQHVAPGVYLLVMEAPGFVKQSKLIITR